MESFIQSLEEEFRRNANSTKAIGQAAYMKNHFDFYGIDSPTRKLIQRPFFVKDHLPSKEDHKKIIKELWKKPQREYHYFAQELAFKYIQELEKSDILLFEYMVVHNSWWDTIDFIAPKLMGAYFKKFPQEREKWVNKWLKSENIWLQRSALLFQLKYKQELDKNLLSRTINTLINSKEFFIQKAIGWVLREYGKTNPHWVWEFANSTPLAPLSYREAVRIIIKQR